MLYFFNLRAQVEEAGGSLQVQGQASIYFQANQNYTKTKQSIVVILI